MLTMEYSMPDLFLAAVTYGGYISLAKLALFLVLFFLMLPAVTWVHQDAETVGTKKNLLDRPRLRRMGHRLARLASDRKLLCRPARLSYCRRRYLNQLRNAPKLPCPPVPASPDGRAHQGPVRHRNKKNQGDAKKFRLYHGKQQ